MEDIAFVGVRPAALTDAAGIAQAYVDNWRTTYRGIVPDAFLGGTDPEGQQDRWRSCWTRGDAPVWMAERSGVIVGHASCGPPCDGAFPGWPGEAYSISLTGAPGLRHGCPPVEEADSRKPAAHGPGALGGWEAGAGVSDPWPLVALTCSRRRTGLPMCADPANPQLKEGWRATAVRCAASEARSHLSRHHLGDKRHRAMQPSRRRDPEGGCGETARVREWATGTGPQP